MGEGEASACPLLSVEGIAGETLYGSPLQVGGSTSSAESGAPIDADASSHASMPELVPVEWTEEEESAGCDDRVPISHLLTHKPVGTAHCDTCMRGQNQECKDIYWIYEA